MTLDYQTPCRTLCSRLGIVAIVLWSFTFAGVCGRALVVKPGRNSVYPVFTHAAENWLHGQPLYVRGQSDEFRYSPVIAAFFVPFDLLPMRVGEFLWRSLNFTLFLGGLLYCCRVGLPRATSATEQACLFLLVLPLSVGSLNNAQSNPLVIGLLLIAVAAVMRDRWMLAAIAVTVSTLFKLYPISVGMLLVLLYPRRFTWRLVVWLAIGALLPFVLQRSGYVIEQYKTWAHYLVTEDRQRGPIADWYRDFRAVWRVYVAPMRASTYAVVETGTAAMIAGVALLGHLRRWPRDLLLAFVLMLACCWMTALGPATESATYIILAPAAVWALFIATASPWRVGYAVVFGLLVASSCALWFGDKGRFFRDRLQPFPVAGVILFVILVFDALRRRPAATSQNTSPSAPQTTDR
jgi:hypothetical protein